jgi:putative endonuclease
MEQFITYILQSESTGRYYIGHTHNLEQRLRQHNEHLLSGSLSTKRLVGPWKLVYSESFETRTEAIKRENVLKSWKNKNAIERFIAQSDRVPTKSGLTTGS